MTNGTVTPRKPGRWRSLFSELEPRDLLAGGTLMAAVMMAFYVSIFVIPELGRQSLAQISTLHKEAAVLLRERDDAADRLLTDRTDLAILEGRPPTQPADMDNISRLKALVTDDQAAQTKIDERIKAFNASPEAQAAMADIELGQNSWRLSYIARATIDQLVLLLTLIMGALGGIIAVARAFVTRDGTARPTPADYFIRPLMGAVIAFVIYMVLQVGQIVLTSEGAANPLNPYPIALAAVVSGMMAAQAIAAIERWGTQLFQRIGGMAAADTVRNLDAVLAGERRRLEKAAKTLASSSPGSAQKTAAEPAVKQAQAALAAAQTAIDKFSADASGDNRAAAQNALGILKLQLDEAVRLVAAAPQP